MSTACRRIDFDELDLEGSETDDELELENTSIANVIASNIDDQERDECGARIEILLNEHMMSDDSVLQEMASKMKDKFHKYWSDYSMILALGTVLDPRMKFEVIEHYYPLIDPIHGHAKIETIKYKLIYIFDQYKEMSGTSSSPTTQSSLGPGTSSNHQSFVGSHNIVEKGRDEKKALFQVYGDFLRVKIRDASSITKSELDYYLKEATLDLNAFIEMNVLDYWKNNQHRFSILSKIACDVLSIPITTVASESAFNIGSRILTKYGSSLLPENVQALVCTRNWLFGWNYDGEGSDDEDDDEAKLIMLDEDNHAIEQASNVINLT
ncbi:zinc finger BED domain-containing protein DAYSLEEPER-like [Prosopis cineraria]|uniref:zinc finger BED domain-containing protein DAYSLEEPER-like n=1 Tax=Prosopis cineraria TaxID=364024 RepID=UPI002410A626|nr:zinc finger BED domain-containing protein DAYSLEEPER-like [Prosopis cineraria]